MTSGIRRVLAVPLLLLLAAGCSQSDAKPAQRTPPPVSVIVAKPESVPLSSEWVATLDGFVNAQIRPQVTGYLIKKNYEEGLPVKKGQVLFEIDRRSFEATLAQATAQLAEAKAGVGRTERDVARDTELVKEGLIPRSQLENDVQSDLAAKAAVESAQAARAIAELNLGFTKVRSLVDGIAAIAAAQIGDLVTPSTLLTTVSQVDPIKAYFSLSEQEYLRVAARLNQPDAPARLWESDAPLTLILADGSRYPAAGAFLAADRQIDPRTGTIRISAAFPNPDHVLRPGQYGRVRAETAVRKDTLLVPLRAVSELQGSSLVRVVGADNKVRVRKVTLGKRVENRWLVEQGLEPDARVVVDAPQLAEGTQVTPRPFVAAPEH
jgi:membrane fusion protein (multidrug efflux system)